MVGEIIVMTFALAVPALVAYSLFKMSPFARHNDRYRDPHTGKRIGESPYLTRNWADV